jgi:hypothetical protein
MLPIAAWMQELRDELQLAHSVLEPLHKLGKEQWADELQTEIELMCEVLANFQRLRYLYQEQPRKPLQNKKGRA